MVFLFSDYIKRIILIKHTAEFTDFIHLSKHCWISTSGQIRQYSLQYFGWVDTLKGYWLGSRDDRK